MTFGQITPGPVLITATFIGWKVAGLAGAVAATLAFLLLLRVRINPVLIILGCGMLQIISTRLLSL
jgi:chromate transporter